MVDKAKIEQAVRLLLEGIGEDITREGLIDTPDRIARIGFEEVQIAGKNRLISDGYFEMFDHRDNECHRQKYWRGDPEAVDEHEQYHIQHAPQNQVEHRHKVEVGEHFGDRKSTGLNSSHRL